MKHKMTAAERDLISIFRFRQLVYSSQAKNLVQAKCNFNLIKYYYSDIDANNDIIGSMITNLNTQLEAHLLISNTTNKINILFKPD
jgi:hypothetical protein